MASTGKMRGSEYRVLQHALVAVRGGDGEAATIEFTICRAALELRVDGFTTDGSSADAALMAARERVTAQGGSFGTEISPAGRRLLWARPPTAAAHA
jgi:hypothetical protein